MKGKKRFSGDNALRSRDSFNRIFVAHGFLGLSSVAMPLEVGTVSTKEVRNGRKRFLGRNALRSRDSFNTAQVLLILHLFISRNALRSRDSFNYVVSTSKGLIHTSQCP